MNEQIINISEGYIPPLWAYGFIQADPHLVLDTWVNWYTDRLGYHVKTSTVTAEFPKILDTLNPLQIVSANKVLLLPDSQNKWVGAFANDLPVPDQNHCSHVASLINANHLAIDDIPAPTESIQPKNYESRQFNYRYKTADNEFQKRVIVASRQGEKRWEFINEGNPLPFENTEQYTQRTIKNRLTHNTLHHYMAELGIHLNQPNYFARQGYLIEFTNPRIPA